MELEDQMFKSDQLKHFLVESFDEMFLADLSENIPDFYHIYFIKQALFGILPEIKKKL